MQSSAPTKPQNLVLCFNYNHKIQHYIRKDGKILKENPVRLCEKFALTVAEATLYFGIGEKKLRSMIENNWHLGLFIQNGTKYLIKRQKFEEFLNTATVI